MGFLDFMTQDIAIDLGTANTLIIHNDKVVVDQPSIVAVDRKTEKSNCSRKKGTTNAWEIPRRDKDNSPT